ncbi:nucleotidyltransferase [Paenibacillus lentus]|uniref:tRNA(Met) cytidine acetate ligase n=1 Tax=Paenibacillus lentus TaxID=1338368 RepID=A0A3Q8S5U4_9BACL|nr:nucleotidyltransferase [Paenibacillus lentus]AZK47835.1 nucleotidyltransferase [Paenibacillus lentus]
MNVVGLIVEYNPFHNGHAYHLAEAKRLAQAEAVVAVMNGDFLQRGEPAIVSKWARAEMALHAGADLVLELPVAYAVQPAEWFAHGAAALLDATGIVSHLCFGSEAGTLAELQPLAQRLAGESGALKAAIAEELATGASYPAAYAAAAARSMAAPQEGGPDATASAVRTRALLEQPNNSLGLHYLIALQRLGSAIAPLTVRREGAGYRDAEPGSANIASATAIRGLITGGSLEDAAPYIPPYTADILAREFKAGRGPITWESFAPTLFHLLLTSSPEDLSKHYEVTEGLENRIKKTLPELKQLNVEELLIKLKTKRYTYTKLQRMLLHILLGHDRHALSSSKLAKGPGYLRVLAFSSTGRRLLKQMKNCASLPIVTRAAALSDPGLALDIRAAAAYANAMTNRNDSEIFRDYQQPPIMV